MKKILLTGFAWILLAASANGQIADAGKEKSSSAAKPLDYGLIVDNSASMRPLLEEIIKAARAVIESNQPNDRAFVVRFVDASKTSVVQELTDSNEELLSAVENLFVEGGQTAILDSVYFSAKHLAENEPASPGRARVLILVTDGETGKSRTKIEDLLKLLKSERIKIYALGISDEKIQKSLLEKLTKETGGKSFTVEKRSELKNIVRELIIAVRTQ